MKGEASEKKPEMQDAVEVKEGRDFAPATESAAERDSRIRKESKSLPEEIAAPVAKEIGLADSSPFAPVGDSRNTDAVEMKSDDELRESLRGSTGPRGNTVKQSELVGAHRGLDEGHPVDLRIDINAFNNHGTYAVTVHEHAGGKGVGKPIGYDSLVRLSGDVTFAADEKVATQIAMGAAKTPIATAKGQFSQSRDLQRISTRGCLWDSIRRRRPTSTTSGPVRKSPAESTQ